MIEISTLLANCISIILVSLSGIICNIAWYDHLKYRSQSLIYVIIISWCIAFFEYVFHVTGNRIGYFYGNLSVEQLFLIAEISLAISFAIYNLVRFESKISWQFIIAMILIIIAGILTRYS